MIYPYLRDVLSPYFRDVSSPYFRDVSSPSSLAIQRSRSLGRDAPPPTSSNLPPRLFFYFSESKIFKDNNYFTLQGSYANFTFPRVSKTNFVYKTKIPLTSLESICMQFYRLLRRKCVNFFLKTLQSGWLFYITVQWTLSNLISLCWGNHSSVM